MSVYKVSLWNLCTKSSLGKIYVGDLVSWQDLLDKISIKSSLGKISWWDLLARPPGQDLFMRSLGKTQIKTCACSWCLVRHEKDHVCCMYFGSGKRVSSYAASLTCVCLFTATFQTTLCRYIIFCELVRAWDDCSKDTVSRSNISPYRKDEKKTGEDKTWQDKTRQEVERRETLCASLRSRSACQDFTRATSYRNLQETCNRPKPRPTLGASLRSRNVCQDFTISTLYRNLQEKCRDPDWGPWSSTGLYTYRKNPSVWTHCLGKNLAQNFCSLNRNHEIIESL